MSYRKWRPLAVVGLAILLAPVSARAADDFYRFQSALPANACITVPMGQFQSGVQVQVTPCNGSPTQSFSYESQNNLTAGGLCLDGLADIFRAAHFRFPFLAGCGKSAARKSPPGGPGWVKEMASL